MIDGVSLIHCAYAGLVGKKARCDDEHTEKYLCFTYVQKGVDSIWTQARDAVSGKKRVHFKGMPLPKG